jgi:hypothetical protein
MAASLHPQNRSPQPRRTPRPPSAAALILGTALLLLSSAATHAGSAKDAQSYQGATPSTQLNPHKTFNLSLLRSGTPPNATKSFSTSAAPSFLTPKFEAKSNTPFARSFDAKTFSSSEFITGPATASSKPFLSDKSVSLEKAKEADSSPFLSKTDQSRSPQTPAAPLPKTPASLTETYEGPEAQKKKIPYTPGNGPAGGVSVGRILSIEEVKEILNKSK